MTKDEFSKAIADAIDRIDKEDQFPEYVMVTTDIKRFAAWFDRWTGLKFEGRCLGYTVYEDARGCFPYVIVDKRACTSKITWQSMMDAERPLL